MHHHYPSLISLRSAWEVESFHLEKFERLRFSDVRIMQSGPLRGTLACEMMHGGSRLSVQISLDAVAGEWR